MTPAAETIVRDTWMTAAAFWVTILLRADAVSTDDIADCMHLAKDALEDLLAAVDQAGGQP